MSITSPEQRAGGVATTASDVYSVAAIFLALLAGDILDGATVPVSAGADGLIIGDRTGTSNKPKPDDAVVH